MQTTVDRGPTAPEYNSSVSKVNFPKEFLTVPSGIQSHSQSSELGQQTGVPTSAIRYSVTVEWTGPTDPVPTSTIRYSITVKWTGPTDQESLPVPSGIQPQSSELGQQTESPHQCHQVLSHSQVNWANRPESLLVPSGTQPQSGKQGQQRPEFKRSFITHPKLGKNTLKTHPEHTPVSSKTWYKVTQLSFVRNLFNPNTHKIYSPGTHTKNKQKKTSYLILHHIFNHL